MPHPRVKIDRRGLPHWVYWMAGVVVLFEPASWAIAGIVDRSDPSAWMLLGCTGISVVAYWLALRWMRVSVVPFIFVFLFLVSYPARVPLVEQNKDLYTVSGGHNSVGNFEFTSAAYAPYYVVSLIGLAGLLVGSSLTISLYRRSRPGFDWGGNRWLRHLVGPCAVWMLFTAGISVICYELNIGLAGIDQPVLPMHLTGCLNFLRMFVAPVAGWFLFGLAYERRADRLVFGLLVFATLHGIASIYFTLSKAGLMYAILPLMAYLVMRAPRRALTWKIVSGSAMLMLLFLPLTYFGAMVLRNEVYFGQEDSRAEAFRRMVADHVGESGGFIKLLRGTIAAVAGRVTGGDELMAVTSGRPYPDSTVWGLVAGRAAEPDYGGPEMFLEIFHVQLIHEDGKFSGKAFGLFAGLFLSHKYWLVFIGSGIFAGLVVWLEQYALLHVSRSVACGFAFWIGLNVWESTFDNLKFYPLILFGMLVAIQFIKRQRRRYAAAGPLEMQRPPSDDALLTT